MKTEKFEEFVQSICKPLGIYPSRDEWSRMNELRERHTPFAIILGREKKRRYVEFKVHPNDERAHMYASILSGHLRRGNTVLYVCFGKPYVYLCNGMDWAKVYRAIVPERLRPRDVQVCECQPYRAPKPQAWSAPIPRDRWKPTDYAAPKSENPYRRRCPNHGFQRTDRANRVMNWLVAF